MYKFFCILLLFYSFSSYALCTWTFMNCDAHNWCYYKGTSSCAGYSCQLQMYHGGEIKLWYDGKEVASGTRDMSVYPHVDCTMLYSHS